MCRTRVPGLLCFEVVLHTECNMSIVILPQNMVFFLNLTMLLGLALFVTFLRVPLFWRCTKSGKSPTQEVDGFVGSITHDLKSLLQYGERVVHWMDLLSRFLLFSPDTGSFISVPGTSLSTFSVPMHKMSIAADECPQFWKCSFQIYVCFWTYCVFL